MEVTVEKRAEEDVTDRRVVQQGDGENAEEEASDKDTKDEEEEKKQQVHDEEVTQTIARLVKVIQQGDKAVAAEWLALVKSRQKAVMAWHKRRREHAAKQSTSGKHRLAKKKRPSAAAAVKARAAARAAETPQNRSTRLETERAARLMTKELAARETTHQKSFAIWA